MDNPEKLSTHATQDEGKQKQKHNKLYLDFDGRLYVTPSFSFN